MNVSYNDIYKRKMVRESSNNSEIEENCKLYLDQYKQNNSMDTLEKFFNECSKSVSSSNKYSSTLFNYTERFSKTNPKLERILVESIAPKLTEYINAPECINEQIMNNNICDRILNNHEKIMNETNIMEYFNYNNDKTLLIEMVCDLVSKFNLNPVGKVAIAIEESNLIANMSNIIINKDDISNKVFRYFAIRENVDIENIKCAAKKNNNTLSEYISSIATDDYSYLFMISSIKDIDYLIKVINTTLIGKNKSIARFVVGIPKVLELIKDILVSTTDENLSEEIIGNEDFLTQNIYNLFQKEYMENEDVKEGIIVAITTIAKEVDMCNTYANNTYFDNTIKTRFVRYGKLLRELHKKFMELNALIYPKYNANIINNIEEGVTVSTIYADPRKNPGYWLLPRTAKAMGLIDDDGKASSDDKEEIKSKLSDIVKRTDDNIDKGINAKSIRGKIKNKIKKVKDAIFRESNSIYDIIDINNHTIDTMVSLYETDGMTAELLNLLNETVRDINETDLKYIGLESYFINMDYFVEFRVHSNIEVKLTEEEIEEANHYISPTELYLMERLDEVCKLNLSPIDIDQLTTLIESDIDKNDLVNILEYTAIDKNIIDTFIDNNRDYKTQQILKNYNPINESAEITMYAFDCINNILNEANKAEEKDEKKEGFKGIDFNNVKLYMKAFQDKTRKLGAKEREISRNLDSAVSHFCTAVQNAVKADSREQIIKGSVIPSFSKCVKIAIAAAGSFGIASLFGASFAPIAPVIVIFGALAGSKMLMQSEKNALVDELEVEMEVLDREIANCESENKPKKLRALLKTKKDLQRQYQRLKLGTNVSKKIAKQLKSSNIGTPKKD